MKNTCTCLICESNMDKQYNNRIIRQLLWLLPSRALLIIGSCHMAHAAAPTEMRSTYAYTVEGHTIHRWTYAIGKAEGNSNYGILSVQCKLGSDCRHICANTVRNNYKRWVKAGKHGTYLAFLAKRYCPTVGVNLRPAERRLNVNWIKNVEFYLTKGV